MANVWHKRFAYGESVETHAQTGPYLQAELKDM